MVSSDNGVDNSKTYISSRLPGRSSRRALHKKVSTEGRIVTKISDKALPGHKPAKNFSERQILQDLQ